ncbi:MAG: ferredoxin [Deltaproteobacteria bacterium]|nr:ferredoxin [Deltaproteobacteria bacterium]
MKMTYLKNVSTLKIDAGKCTGCAMCTDVCPHGVLAVEAKKACIKDIDACMECGACSMNCPASAISVQQGVGCAQAIINGMIRGTAPECGCGCDTGSATDSKCC